MKNKSALYHCKWFFAAVTFLLLFGFCLLLLTGKSGSFFLLNPWHDEWLNLFFQKLTLIGDGWFALIITCLALIFYKQKKVGISLLYAFVVSGIAAQMIKRMLPAPRPKLYFEPGVYQHFIEGVTLAGNNSFPSGHTATVFALATVIAITLKFKRVQFVCFIVAAIVGYSRVYLGQHFLLDVMMGTIVGVLSGVLSIQLAEITSNSKSSFRRRVMSGNERFSIPSSTQRA